MIGLNLPKIGFHIIINDEFLEEEGVLQTTAPTFDYLP